jgi:hypothetical protein
MAGDAALSAGVARLFTGPLVRGALLVRGLAPLARNLPLLGPIHRCKSAIFLGHVFLPPVPHVLIDRSGASGNQRRHIRDQLCNGSASDRLDLID